jgi:hypothetical protein
MDNTPPKKKRKFVVLKRRPVTDTEVETVESATPDVLNDDTDIYDLSAHITEVRPAAVEMKVDAVKPEPVQEKKTLKKATHSRNTRSNSKSTPQDVVDLDAEETPDDTPDDNLLSSDSDMDPDRELQEALARARRLKEEKEHAEALLSVKEQTKEPQYSPPVEETPRKMKKPKAYRGEKVCFRLTFPVIEGHSWPSVIFTTRSLVPFHEIQEKLTFILHQRCQEDELYAPPDHVLDEFIFVLRGSRIFRNSTCQTMGISTRDPATCPEVQWLNAEDAEKFRKRSLMEDDDDELVPQLDHDDGLDSLADVSVNLGEPAAAEPEEPDEEDIELTMAGKDKKPVTVRVGISRQFIKLAEHYAKEMNVPATSVQLYFDGDKIDLNSTIEQADVEDEDMLEVRLV